MQRTHTCGLLRLEHVGAEVQLCGWVHHIRDKGNLLWIDLRDRYGITQLVLEQYAASEALFKQARELGREYVIQVSGVVIARSARNDKLPTGDIEVQVKTIKVLNPSALPPFCIEEITDGGEALRMQYRYLDLRRMPMQRNLHLRHHVMRATRNWFDDHGFIEVETPLLIRSTPEGARDFIVPAKQRGYGYALPQSPQILKQLLMVGGCDRYYQIARCFRDEDLRSDRQVEFTQIDCELSFVGRDDLLQIFEDLIRYIFLEVQGISLPIFRRLTYRDAMRMYGTDKPDLRLDMPMVVLPLGMVKGRGFELFDQAACVAGIRVTDAGDCTRKQLNHLQEGLQRVVPEVSRLVYVKSQKGHGIKSSVDKFYGVKALRDWYRVLEATPGDLLLLLGGEAPAVQQGFAEVRRALGASGMLQAGVDFAPVWISDFPWLSWDTATCRYRAVHHPFTAPMPEDMHLVEQAPETVRANAYDLVINGVELGGGSVRIHEYLIQEQLFQYLGMSPEDIQKEFGFLVRALRYGAPPHGGIAMGLDRLCVLLGGGSSIRDYIAFPKNNAGRDVMLDAPAPLPV